MGGWHHPGEKFKSSRGRSFLSAHLPPQYSTSVLNGYVSENRVLAIWRFWDVHGRVHALLEPACPALRPPSRSRHVGRGEYRLRGGLAGAGGGDRAHRTHTRARSRAHRLLSPVNVARLLTRPAQHETPLDDVPFNVLRCVEDLACDVPWLGFRVVFRPHTSSAICISQVGVDTAAAISGGDGKPGPRKARGRRRL